jgi:hypothetical protein
MQILIAELTRLERLALIEKAIEELEEHGYGEIIIKVCDNQVVDCNLMKNNHFGNSSDMWYRKRI